MKVIVLHGTKKHEIVIPGSATVSELKDKLKGLTGVAAEAQDLQMMGDSLCDEASLAEQGVQDRDKIQLVTSGAAAAAAPPAPEPGPPQMQPAERREKGVRPSSSSKPRSGHSRGGASPSRSRTGAGASPSGARSAMGSSANGGRAPATASGGSSSGGGVGALESAMQALDGIGGRLNELEEQVRSRQPPHQELFTRVLEQLDSLDLDRCAPVGHLHDPFARLASTRDRLASAV